LACKGVGKWSRFRCSLNERKWTRFLGWHGGGGNNGRAVDDKSNVHTATDDDVSDSDDDTNGLSSEEARSKTALYRFFFLEVSFFMTGS
jgi:hypothetical protein